MIISVSNRITGVLFDLFGGINYSVERKLIIAIAPIGISYFVFF
jgi:hypothetical protein